MRALSMVWLACWWAGLLDAGQAEREAASYSVETFPFPESLKLEVSGIALLPDGRVAVAIRKGEIWLLEQADSPEETQYHRFASGLHEPLGLAWHEGDLYTVQRTELTRLRDRDGDGVADQYFSYAKGWGVTGAYHEYAYGPVFDRKGNAWLTLNSTMGTGMRPDDNAWRGWSLSVSPQREWRPVSGGFRSPCGLGVNGMGDVFASDQQGNWFPTCCLIHVRPGVFHGHRDALPFCELPGATFELGEPLPKGLTVVEAAAVVDAYELPAVWFPYRKMGMSTTDILCDVTEGRFGPFAGQLFVGEFTQSFVSRVILEKVNGVYQGACIRFREGLQCGVLRLGWTPGGALLVGQTNRGWNSLGPRSYGLQLIRYTGRIPFEILSMTAQPHGFRLAFTQALAEGQGESPGSYRLQSYTYPYHQRYGGDEIDLKALTIQSIDVAPDRKSVDLTVAGLRAGYVHELTLDGLKSRAGESLLHSSIYYTLNQVPSESR